MKTLIIEREINLIPPCLDGESLKIIKMKNTRIINILKTIREASGRDAFDRAKNWGKKLVYSVKIIISYELYRAKDIIIIVITLERFNLSLPTG